MAGDKLGKHTHLSGTPDEEWSPEALDLVALPLDQEPPPRHIERRELVEAVKQALCRFGIDGQLTIRESTIVLRSARGLVEQDVGYELSHWEHQDKERRQQMAYQLARKLAQRGPSIQAPAKTRHLGSTTLKLAVVALGLLGLIKLMSSRASLESFAAGSPRNLAQRSPQASTLPLARGVSVCQATRSRVYRGGLVSMADAEGWVVELSMIAPPGEVTLSSRPQLNKYVGPRSNGSASYIWEGEPHLALAEASKPQVNVSDFALKSPDGSRSGLLLTFTGSYVESYFDEISRDKFYHLAHSIATDLKPDYAALYARCAHDELHTIGSWFLGNDASGAAAALLYFLGTFSAPLHLASEYLNQQGQTQIDRPLALSSITRGTTHIDRQALATLVGSEGGMAIGGAGQPVILSFPFQDGNRASRVSRTLARVTSMAP